MNYGEDRTGRDRLCFMLCSPDENGLVEKAGLQGVLENSWGGSPEQLEQIMAKVPANVNFDAFCRLTAASYRVTLAIMSAVPEAWRPTRSSPAFQTQLTGYNLAEKA